MLLAAVFLGGRYWERTTTKKSASTASLPATQRVVVVVLTDHLDRTERLLVQLNHRIREDGTDNAELQSEARELLASNRLYRTSASNAGDPALAGALDQLEGVLAEIANDPKLTASDLDRVRKEMNTEGIFFEIRVLLTRNPDQKSGSELRQGSVDLMKAKELSAIYLAAALWLGPGTCMLNRRSRCWSRTVKALLPTTRACMPMVRVPSTRVAGPTRWVCSIAWRKCMASTQRARSTGRPMRRTRKASRRMR